MIFIECVVGDLALFGLLYRWRCYFFRCWLFVVCYVCKFILYTWVLIVVDLFVFWLYVTIRCFRLMIAVLVLILCAGICLGWFILFRCLLCLSDLLCGCFALVVVWVLVVLAACFSVLGLVIWWVSCDYAYVYMLVVCCRLIVVYWCLDCLFDFAVVRVFWFGVVLLSWFALAFLFVFTLGAVVLGCLVFIDDCPVCAFWGLRLMLIDLVIDWLDLQCWWVFVLY